MFSLGDTKPHSEGRDDLVENTLSLVNVNLLYNLIDLYVVSSRSEDGPKAVLEAVLTKRAIVSTDVGFGREFLAEDAIVEVGNPGDLASLIEKALASPVLRNKWIEFSYPKKLQQR